MPAVRMAGLVCAMLGAAVRLNQPSETRDQLKATCDRYETPLRQHSILEREAPPRKGIFTYL